MNRVDAVLGETIRFCIGFRSRRPRRQPAVGGKARQSSALSSDPTLSSAACDRVDDVISQAVRRYAAAPPIFFPVEAAGDGRKPDATAIVHTDWTILFGRQPPG